MNTVYKNMIFGFNKSFDANPFIIKVKTDNVGTSAPNQFTLPLQSVTGLTYDYVVDWGDGEITSHNTSANYTKTYSTAGTYEIRIYGKFEKIHFNNDGDRLKLLEVLQWGDLYGLYPNQSNAFYGCTNLTAIADDCYNWNNFVTACINTFGACPLTELPSTMTLNNLVNGTSMFRLNLFTELPPIMILSNLVNGNSMFLQSKLTKTPNLMLSNVTDPTGFVRDCTSFMGGVNIGDKPLVSINSLAWNNGFKQDLSTWNFDKNCNFGNPSFNPSFGNRPAFSNENWGKLLIRVENQCGSGKGRTATKVLGHSQSKYPATAAAARAALIADGWIVNDNGAE